MFNFSAIILSISLFLAGCASESLTIKSYAPTPEQGVTISGKVYKPEGDGPFPGIIFMGGCIPNSDNEFVWARKLQKWGYATLIVDSYSPRGVYDNCDKNRVLYLERALDAHAAKVQFGALPFVDESRVGIMGYCHGATTILAAANRSFLFGLPDEAAYPFKAAVALYPWCGRSVGEVNTNLMILIGDKDDWTPASLCTDNIPKPSSSDIEVIYKVYPDAYHMFDYNKNLRTFMGHWLGYNQKAMNDAEPRIKAFFDMHLR